MSVEAADLLAVLPADHQVDAVRVVDLEVKPDVDSQGEDAVLVTLTLALPEGETWDTHDMYRLRVAIRRALVQADEERSVIFMIRPESDPDAIDEGPPPRFGL